MKCKKLNFKMIEIILFLCSKNNTYLVLHKALIDLIFFHSLSHAAIELGQ